MNRGRQVYRAGQVVDGSSLDAAPGAVLVEDGAILAAGSPEAVGAVGGAEVIDLPDHVITPALVNVHAHLDLTHIGLLPCTGDFASWAATVRTRRLTDPAALRASVQRGAALALAGGTAVIGDIAGAAAVDAVDALRDSPLIGVSYLEVFGIGRRASRGVAQLHRTVASCTRFADDVRLGLQPHAPYSCGIAVYRAAVALSAAHDLPLSTHLAETLDELEFAARATGPLAAMLRDIGVWDDTIAPHRAHPIEVLADVLAARPWTAAHLNYIDEVHLDRLAGWPLTVAYCPRASAYFGHPHDDHPPHAYRVMRDRGVRVALGTDSILCLDTPDRISVLDDMRFLHRRDGTDARTLLRMATVHGAAALGVDESLVTLRPGRVAGLLALRAEARDDQTPLAAALRDDAPPRWLAGPGVSTPCEGSRSG